MKRNILLCVAGATPQIITETLYALTVRQDEKIDEIRVITTLDGRDKIMTGIIKGRGSAEESLLNKEKGQFFAFLRDYPQVGKIEFDETKIALLRTRDGRTLDDIRTPEENELAGDQICEIVREICMDETVNLFASAAGGRKTMSIYLTAAMQLFGRADDSLSHVLVSADFETNRDFFYPPPTPKKLKILNPATKEEREVSTADAEIYLAPIPFICLRGIGVEAFDDKAKTYKQAVDKAQSDLKLAESAYELRLDLKRNRLRLADRIVKLSLREFFVYSLFAYFRKKGMGKDGFVALNKINREHLDTICRLITTLIYNRITTHLNMVGLDPYQGFFHQARNGHAALASDLMEEFRPAFADVLVLKLLRRKQLKPDDFEYQKGEIHLTKDATKVFFTEFENKMASRRKSPAREDLNLTFAQIIKRQVYHFAKVIGGEESFYKPFKII